MTAGPLYDDWDRLLGQARKARQGHGMPYDSLPAVVLPCELVLSLKQGPTRRVLNVRCRCQAQTRNAPAQRFFRYDVLGTAVTLPEAVSLWREHCASQCPVPD